VNILKDWSGNQIIATFDQPPAALVTTSQMEAERNIRKFADYGIVHFYASL
jgi:hypothetical protein